MRSLNKNSIIIKSLFLCLVFAVTIGMVGCAPQGGRGPAQSAPPRPAYLEHTVRYSGETLAVISGWYTGSNQNWKQIIDANPGLRPERIRLGQLILIPKSLVVKDAPLPEGYVRRFAGRSVEKADTATGSEGGVETTDGAATTTTATESAQDSSVTPVAADSGSADVGTTAVAADGAASAVPADNAVTDSGATVGNSTAEPSPSTSPEATPPGPSEADKERERLLDELLKQ